jgi:succinate dehydrogenase flavin-adding protein (antitoxin of CptAB toxin-antitoxin module)
VGVNMREQEVREYLTDMGLDDDEFFEWMTGQTVGVNEDFSPDYFEHDVKRWVESKTNKTELMWD